VRRNGRLPGIVEFVKAGKRVCRAYSGSEVNDSKKKKERRSQKKTFVLPEIDTSHEQAKRNCRHADVEKGKLCRERYLRRTEVFPIGKIIQSCPAFKENAPAYRLKCCNIYVTSNAVGNEQDRRRRGGEIPSHRRAKNASGGRGDGHSGYGLKNRRPGDKRIGGRAC